MSQTFHTNTVHHRHLNDDAAEAEVERVIASLRSHQVRISAPRKAILKYLIQSQHHPTVDMIYHDLIDEFPGMSLATVYNNLNFLVEQGIVAEMKFSDVTSHYDYLGHQHGHIVCEECGKIEDVHLDMTEQLLELASQQTKFQMHKLNLELFGICYDCQLKNKTSQ